MIYDLLIIGGGISGVFSYLTYKKRKPNSKCLIIERNNSLLKKLSISGNGKCNFTNDNLNYKKYNNGDIFKNIIIDNKKILSLFDDLGIVYYKDEEGRFYPYSNSAKSVQTILTSLINTSDILLNTTIFKIEYDNTSKIWTILSKDNKEFKSKNVLISTGSVNYPSLGSDGIIFKTIKDLGIKFTNIYPSNIYINCKEIDVLKELSGLRFKACVSLYNNNKHIYSESGEVLFKDKALSGIVTFNVSSKLALLYKNNLISNPYLTIDFMEDYSIDDLSKLFKKENDLNKTLLGLFHPNLVNIIYKKSKNLNDVISNIKSFRFEIDSLGDFEHAQVACGGIDSKEINERLESNRFGGLYFSGDILDCDAPCGGYNISFAILSGIKVGESIE